MAIKLVKLVKRTRRLGVLAVGAAAMYLWDPDAGARRRSQLRRRLPWWSGTGGPRAARSLREPEPKGMTTIVVTSDGPPVAGQVDDAERLSRLIS